MLIDSGKTYNEQKVEYSIEDNGYTIYLDGAKWITQPEPYAKLFVKDGSYEDNAKAQIEEITAPQPEVVTTEERVSNLEEYSADMLYQLCLVQLGTSDADVTE